MEQQNQDQIAALFTGGIFLVIILVALVIGIAISAVICYFVSSLYKRIPAEHRRMEPNMVWFLLIPCVPLVFNFFVYPKLAESMKSYFDSIGRTDVEDCGAKLALYYAISTACCLVPLVNYLAGPASLVLLILFLVKANELTKQIAAAALPFDPK